MSTGIRETVLIAACLLGMGLSGCHSQERTSEQKSESNTPAAPPPRETQNADKLELFTWWSSPGEKEAMEALIKVFNRRFPTVKISDLTEVSGGGADAHRVLRERIKNKRPPDCFQIYTWSLSEFVMPGNMAIDYLDSLYGMKYLGAKLPKKVVETITHNNHYYAAPISINRRNVLYSNPDLVASPPKTLTDFFEIADSLKEKGVPVLAVATRNGDWPFMLLFESILAGSQGNDFFVRFYERKLDIRDPETRKKIGQFTQDLDHALDFAVPDAQNYSWEQAADAVAQGKIAMFFHGNWVDGYLNVKKQTVHITPAPGTGGLFNFGVDSFAFCKNGPHPANARRFLSVAVSPEGQAAFNRIKGGLPALKDVSVEGWSETHQALYADYKSATHLFSMGHYIFNGLETQIGDLYRNKITPKQLAKWIIEHYDTELYRFDSPHLTQQ